MVILLVCIFAFIPLLIAEFARVKARPTVSDFFLQGRGLNTFSMYATVFATWMSAFAFMGAISYFYEQGPIYMTTVGWDALFAILFYLIGRRIWFYGKRREYITPTDFFNDIYNSKHLNIIVTTVTIIFTLLYIQLQMVGGLILIQVASRGAISWQVSGLIFFAILIVYLWAGGLRAVALTDMFYGLLIVVTILSSGIFLMKTAGGMEYMFSQVINDNVNNVTLQGPEGSHRTGLWLSLFVIVPVGAFMGPQMWIRNYGAKSVRNFELLPLLLCLSSIICIGTLFAGSAGILLNEQEVAEDTLIASLMLQYGNPLFCAFVFVGIAAAIFSTANSQIHALSAIYTIDIYKRYMNPKVTERSLLSIGKWSVAVISIFAYLLLLIIPRNIFDMGILAMGGMGQLIIPVLGALFWKKSSSKGAVTGLIAGLAVLFLLEGMTVMDTSYCAISGLICNGIVFVIVSYLTKERGMTERKIEEYKEEFSKEHI
ncbi:MAG: sodium:solute symporter family protein [Anaerovoracaceae bacterium]